MSDLSSIEKLKLEKLFEMGGGYVLDFSNRTFQEFMLENMNVDIYDQKYSHYSGSKANRLRAFWATEPNLLVGDLIDKLLEYWSVKRSIDNRVNTSQEEDLYEQCKAIAAQLQGKSRAIDNSKSQQGKLDTQLRVLLTVFDQFASLTSASDKRQRGYLLEDLLQKVFAAYGISTEKSFKRNDGGEQIDGAFTLDGWHYIVECKWTEGLSDIRQLDSLYGKLNRSGRQTMGLFLSINGWSTNVVPLLKQNPNKSILLMDGYDLRCVLDEHVNITLRELIAKKLSHLNFDSGPFYSVSQIIAERNK